MHYMRDLLTECEAPYVTCFIFGHFLNFIIIFILLMSCAAFLFGYVYCFLTFGAGKSIDDV